MKILLAESDVKIRELLVKTLESLDCEVKVVGNGASALIALMKPDAPPLAILSVVLPGVSGIDACKQLRAKLGEKCAALTLVGPAPLPENPADFFLQKPFDDEEALCTALARILRKVENGTVRGTAPLPPAPSPEVEAPATAEEGSPTQTALDDRLWALKSCTSNAALLVKALAGFGLASITIGERNTAWEQAPGEISIWSILILPEKDIWFDLLLEADRASVESLYQTVLGENPSTLDELNDILREALNLLQGTFKTAFAKAQFEVLTPVIPKAVPPEKVPTWIRSLRHPLHYLFKAPGMAMKMTLFPCLSKPQMKSSDLITVATVLTQAVPLPGQNNTVLFNKGTILTKRYLEKLQNIAELEERGLSVEAIEPSMLTELLM